MSYENLILRMNRDRKDLEILVDFTVEQLLNSTTAANYLYSKEIDKLYFHLGCNKIDLDDFRDTFDWVVKKTKENKGE